MPVCNPDGCSVAICERLVRIFYHPCIFACFTHNYLPINIVLSDISLPNKYHAQLSFPVILLSGIHFNRPTLTIFEQYFIRSALCFVCIQSASNNSQVGALRDKWTISGCKILRSHGGLVMNISPWQNERSNTSQVTIPPDLGSMSEIKADRKSTRLNSSHLVISYAVFCLKHKTEIQSPCKLVFSLLPEKKKSDRN